MSMGGILLESEAGDAVLSLHLDLAVDAVGVVVTVELVLVVAVVTVDEVVVVQVVVEVAVDEDCRSILIIPSFGLVAGGEVGG